MHIPALDFCWRAEKIIGPVDRVIEFGSRNVNGSARDFWPDAEWTGTDIEPGPGVDLVWDACDPFPARCELAVSTEMLEHCPDPSAAVQTMIDATTRWVLITCATHGRAPHSSIDGGNVRADEHYGNVDPSVLEHPRLTRVLIEVHERGDLYYLGRVDGEHDWL